MKKALALMVLVISSFSVQANVVSQGTSKVVLSPFLSSVVSILATSMVSSDVNLCKEAQQIIADGQVYALTGELAPYLKQSVDILQAESSDLSTDEAVDFLVEKAVSILE